MAVGARSGTGEPEEPAGSGESAQTAAPGGPARPVDPGQPTGPGRPPGPGVSMDKEQPADEEESGSVKKGKKPRAFWKELPILIGIALVLALIIKTFLVQAFSIPSDSMQDTLQRGDRVLVDKLTPWFGSEPERGEVVVFHDPGGWLNEVPTPEPNAIQQVLSFIGLMPSAEEKDLIKRVIAVGGDTVECHGTGPVKVNGTPLKEDEYLFPGNTPCGDKEIDKITVPKGSIWVMGDHRQDSLDSRYHTNLKGNGTVEVKQVVGRAFTIAWPINRWSWLSVPDTFDQPALNKAMAATPAALGLVGAVPIVLWRRRRRTARAARATEQASD
ncbi:signal peptidase I [Streptomyces sp. NPDC018019]|uniref:signal peptidase I n=1 Tax=Streptomyces sp. NPDC018019 TaxID=3365030 RepID=UPI0037AE1EB0